MAEIGRLSVKVPIKFSEKAQRDLYEICMAYKKLAEMRGTENAKLRKIVREQAANIEGYSCNECPYNEECDLDTVPMHDGCRMYAEMRELGIEENG